MTVTFAGYFKILIALLVAVDPLGAIPAFILMGRHHSELERRQVAKVASIAVTIILSTAVLIGEHVLHFFGISIPSFKVGGAILIMLMAISMLQAQPVRDKQTPEEKLEAGHKESIAVVPLAIPLLAGPGAISTVIIYTANSNGFEYKTFMVCCCVVVGIATWLSLNVAVPVAKLLGKTGINVAVRLMGIILASLAVEIFTSGIVVLLPGLK